jgi:Mlc titration factor MtfA (ptsG expression regulator)
MFGWLTERRRKHILENPFPVDGEAILRKNVAAYARLSEEEQQRLRDLAQVFIAEKNWEGCGGLEIGDEHRITIAAEAGLLLMGRDHDLYNRLVTILVYPSLMVLPVGAQHRRGPREPEVVISGEAVGGDVVILAWDEVLRGARNANDGKNVVIHEMAHIIDFLDGQADGTPPLRYSELRTWAEVFSEAFLALRKAEKPSVLDEYGATNEAEFFAVATEAFFERAKALKDELPELYELLAKFYNLDLAGK